MASTFSSIFLFLSLFLFISPFSCARYPSYKFSLSSTAKSPKGLADKLIRELNLFPKKSINIAIKDHSLDTAPNVVEKEVKFNLLGDPGTSVEDFGHHAGYYRLPNTNGARMFYLFFESRNSTNDPVVIWLTGGPGCSSQLALFYENGPFKITNNLSLEWNDYGWDKASNIIYVDQPIGTGFSYTTDENDIRNDEVGVSTDLYDFLQAFFKEHPQFAKNDFYITGESYAGHYIPALAARVQQGNQKKEGIHINLKGLAIGNGLTDPGIQYKAYPDFALDNKLISQSDYERINELVPDCEQAIQSCGSNGTSACITAQEYCEAIFQEILSITGDINYYDIRKTCEGQLCYDFSNVELFLNKQNVKDALGVGDIEFVSCSVEVNNAMQEDFMRNYAVTIPPLLEGGIKVIIYAGEKDLICNWLGNIRWVQALKWSGQGQFRVAGAVPFVVQGVKAGELKTHGPLAFLKVYSSGHMVPMDQPKAALQMLTSWMQGKLK